MIRIEVLIVSFLIIIIMITAMIVITPLHPLR